MHLGLPCRLGHEVLGQLAGRRLGAAHDLGPVARRHEGDLHRGASRHRRHGRDHLWRDGVDGQLGTPSPARVDQRSAQRVVGAGTPERGGHVRRVGRRQQQRRVTDRLGHRPDAAGDHGDAGRHGLDERHPEPLVHREREVDVGGGEVRRQRGVGDLAGEAHRVGQAEVVGRSPAAP